MKLQTKVILLILSMVMATAALITLFSTIIIEDAWQKDLKKEGGLLAQTISELVSKEVIDGNVIWVQEALRRTTDQVDNLDYLVIIGFDGRFFAHSFEEGLPKGILSTQNNPDSHQVHTKKILLDTIPILDISRPLIPGMRAYIHVGMNELTAIGQVRSIILLCLGVGFLVSVFGCCIAWFISRRIVRPITEFTNKLEELKGSAQSETLCPISISGAGKEVSLLLTAYNGLILSQSVTLEKLRGSEERLRELAENIKEVFWLSTPDLSKVFYVNPAYEEIWQKSCDSLYEQPLSWLDSLPGEDKHQVLSFIKEKIKENHSELIFPEFRLMITDSVEKWISARAYPIRNEFGKVIRLAGIAEDITERKIAEQAIVQATAEWSVAMDAYEDVIYLLDLNRRVVHANKAFFLMTGRTPQTTIGRHIVEIIHPQGEDEPCAVCRAQEGKHDAVVTMEPDHSSNPSGKPVEITVKIVRDNKGQPLSILMSIRDLTQERNQQEKRAKLEAQLRQAQKMEAIGTLAGGIAHDFNNILSPILGYSEMALTSIPPENPVHDDLLEVVKASKRARDLVKQILTFGRQGTNELIPLKVQLIIKEALKLLRSSIPVTIEIKENVDTNAPAILASPVEIHQVVMNLCTNAYQAMREQGGVLAVSVTQLDLGADEIKTKSELKPGKYIRLEVADTGKGMAQDIVHRIFEPYFTTKGIGEGTGLGLAVTHGIVRKCRGEIMVYSEPGKGTIFHVYFPAIEADPIAPEIEFTEILPTGSEHVLLVDDVEEIVRLEQRMLESLGYVVSPFTKSEEALKAFKARPQDYDLIISDVTMPKITGLQLTKEILEFSPDMPIILCSGFSEIVNETKAKALGVRRYLMKPIVKKDLAEAVRKVLG